MTKPFLTYTAIIEGLTGLALIAIPAKTGLLLLETELSSPLDILLAMVGGAAIFSLALGTWFARSDATSKAALNMLLFYNGAVACILLYGALGLGFKGILLWAVIIFHFCQTGICIGIIRKTFLNKVAITKN